MNDPADEITDALVEFVKELSQTSDPSVSLIAKVRKTDNPLGELEHETTDLTVLFHPFSAAAEKSGRGTFQEDLTITMLVVRKMTSEFTMGKLLRYVREVKVAIRGRKMAGFTHSADDTPVYFDAEQRKTLGQFASVSHFMYTGFASCE